MSNPYRVRNTGSLESSFFDLSRARAMMERNQGLPEVVEQASADVARVSASRRTLRALAGRATLAALQVEHQTEMPVTALKDVPPTTSVVLAQENIIGFVTTRRVGPNQVQQPWHDPNQQFNV